MQPALGHVVERLHRIAIGDFRHVEVLRLEEACDHEVGGAGDGRPVELSGLARAMATSSPSDLTLSDGGTVIDTSVALTRATGARSRGS